MLLKKFYKEKLLKKRIISVNLLAYLFFDYIIYIVPIDGKIHVVNCCIIMELRIAININNNGF